MKTILLTLLLAFPFIAFSQTEGVYQYCMVSISGKALSNKVSIEIDYGQEQRFLGDNSSFVKDEKGNNRTFNSIAHALNYMASMGWRVIQAINVKNPDGPDIHRYLMEARKNQSLLKVP